MENSSTWEGVQDGGCVLGQVCHLDMLVQIQANLLLRHHPWFDQLIHAKIHLRKDSLQPIINGKKIIYIRAIVCTWYSVFTSMTKYWTPTNTGSFPAGLYGALMYLMALYLVNFWPIASSKVFLTYKTNKINNNNIDLDCWQTLSAYSWPPFSGLLHGHHSRLLETFCLLLILTEKNCQCCS